MEITNSLKKLIKSLDSSKGRRHSGLFMAQGSKCVADTIAHYTPYCVVATQQWLDENSHLLQEGTPVARAGRGELKEMTSLHTVPDVIAVYHQPPAQLPPAHVRELAIALDTIQDPGNLGTIIRLASWMGIEQIFCTPETADIYNPKVVQSTMGALARVNVTYCDLGELLDSATKEGTPVYGTFLDGDNIYDTTLTPDGIIVMGNEGNGISPAIAAHVTHRLSIPPYPADSRPQDSLNVAVATAITVAEFRRRSRL